MRRGIKWESSEAQVRANAPNVAKAEVAVINDTDSRVMTLEWLESIESNIEMGFRWRADFEDLVREVRRVRGWVLEKHKDIGS